MPPGRFPAPRPPAVPGAHYVTERAQLPAGAHAMFTAGRGYYGGAHPAIQPPAKPLKPLAAKPKSQSVSDVANQQVNQQLAPVLGAQDKFNTTQNAAIQSFALALLGKLQPVAGQVGADYDKSIGQTAALSGATAQALRNANPNQQDQQMLAAINAPQEQRAQIENQNANTFGGGAAALQFTQGEVPGTQMATNRAAAVSQAAQLPGIAALKGQQDLSSALGQQGQRRAETLAQRPALVQQATQTIKGNLQAKQSAAFDEYKFQTARADAYRSAGMKAQASAAQKKADLAYKYASLDSQNTRAANAQANQNARTQAQIDAANKRAAATLKANALKAKDVKKTKASDYPNLTKAQVLHLRSGIANAWSGIPEHKDASGKVTQEKLPAVSYQDAIDHAVKAGYSRAAATKMANRFYAPGQRGRPAKPKPDTGFRGSTLAP